MPVVMAQVQKVQRVLDRGAETHDGQRTHHTERNHDVGANRQGDHGSEHSHTHQGDGEAAAIDNTHIKLAIDQIDQRTRQQGR